MDDRNDDDDPTRVLDGWTAARDTPQFDPTRVLDGWKPDAGQARKPDPTPPLIGAWQPSIVARAAEARRAGLPEDLDLGAGARQAKWDRNDFTDVDAIWRPSAAVVAAAGQRDEGWRPEPISASRKPAVPRVLDQWQPGAWIGAVKSVFGSVAQLTSTPQGPLVDTFAAHVLLALWPPQSPQAPFLGRWPQRVLLCTVPAEDAAAELLKHLPPGADLWLAEHDIDWALVGQAVLLHDPGLREFQLEQLRAFIDAQRQATWDRVNQAYRLPAAGAPIERT
jgi:hypothetical protein